MKTSGTLRLALTQVEAMALVTALVEAATSYDNTVRRGCDTGGRYARLRKRTWELHTKVMNAYNARFPVAPEGKK